MNSRIDIFERFLVDGGIYSPDLYMTNEPEDFSPEGCVNVSYINKFAKSYEPELMLANIA